MIPSYRTTDPVTSRLAAERAGVIKREHYALIADALFMAAPAGKDELARRTGLTGVAVCRRLVEMERNGIVKPTGRLVKSDAGRAEREWTLA